MRAAVPPTPLLGRIATPQRPALAPAPPCPAAIRFVLDDLNSSLSQEERRRLLHVSCRSGAARVASATSSQPPVLHYGQTCNPAFPPLPSLGVGALFSLLQESVGHHVLSAYVEIVFDNSDGRLPVDKTEVGAGWRWQANSCH